MKKAHLFFTSLFLGILLVFPLKAEKTKQALRAYAKGDYEKVEDVLIKSMAQDSLNPATEYVWALLYSTDSYAKYHLDTAHFFIQSACKHIKLQNEDHLDELDDADLSENDLRNRKITIDSMAFAHATTVHEVGAYNHFISRYQDAAEYDQAVATRNHLVYLAVEAEHTWQSYQDFIEKYPDAIEVEKAKIQYDRLVYEDKAKYGKVAELEKFLSDEPNTPYRHAIEYKIFEDYIGELNSDRLVDFLRKYKNDALTRKALNVLYYLDGFDFSSLTGEIKVSRQYTDSLSQLAWFNAQPLVVTQRHGKYEFLTLTGKPFLNKSYQNIDESYRCGNVQEDLLVVESEGVRQLINKKGAVIYEGFSGSVLPLGNGLLAVEEDGKFGVVHKSGFRLLEAEYENLKLLNGSLLAYEEKGKIGLMTTTGRSYVKPKYDSIYTKGQFWIFEKGGLFGVSNLENIQSAKDKSFVLDLPFEEVEWINDHYVIGFEEETEVLINTQLEVITPPVTKRINTKNETWVIELADGYTTFDPELGQLSSNVYQGVLQNTEWLGLTRNGKWFVYNKNIYDEPIIGVDSLKLLGEDIAIVFRGKSGMAIFPNKKVVDIVEDQYLKSIGPKVQTDTHFLVIKKDGENVLYKDGVEQFRLTCDELGYISDSAFFIKKNGEYGAVGLDGRLIMRVRYDAISAAEDEVAPVLFNGKFGAYNFRDRILLRMDYQEKIKPYNHELFIVNEGGVYGLLDRYNTLQVTPAYEQIEYWSDTTFLGLQDGIWQLINMNDGTVVLTDVLYYEFILNNSKEKILLIRKEDGYGVYHSDMGVIIPPVFHDVMNIGNDSMQLYFTETAVPEADMYVVVYYDTFGEKLFSEAYRSEAYDALVCED
ncbi:hypothetical protein N7E81_18480 [Reichenbachiella carrageenanivorans]|uniref:WG containing repeat-containing protein n=1 Tax=Reichenbachiella carrageenanivorans TaxID=2979869 RepID=A0ABY6CZR9_9BACT|nr:hypothetical protein [Reichenbachiella carrageenanivorans]UXX79343.1 hypothetical protein N7E81_18480 [Reichenbachiella carrageenanivorans]